MPDSYTIPYHIPYTIFSSCKQFINLIPTITHNRILEDYSMFEIRYFFSKSSVLLIWLIFKPSHHVSIPGKNIGSLRKFCLRILNKNKCFEIFSGFICISLIYLCTQQIYIEQFLCAKHYSICRLYGYSIESRFLKIRG